MQVVCASCAELFEAKRSTAKFCGGACRERARRTGLRVVAALPAATPGEVATISSAAGPRPFAMDAYEDDGSLTWSTINDLRQARRLDTSRGRLAVKAARIIDASTAVMGMAALMKEFEQRLEAALAGSEQGADPLDEVNRRRAQKTRGTTTPLDR